MHRCICVYILMDKLYQPILHKNKKCPGFQFIFHLSLQVLFCSVFPSFFNSIIYFFFLHPLPDSLHTPPLLTLSSHRSFPFFLSHPSLLHYTRIFFLLVQAQTPCAPCKHLVQLLLFSGGGLSSVITGH